MFAEMMRAAADMDPQADQIVFYRTWNSIETSSVMKIYYKGESTMYVLPDGGPRLIKVDGTCHPAEENYAQGPDESTKRLSFILSDSAFANLRNLMRQSQRSMTEIVRYGVGLVQVAEEAKREGLRLVVVNESNQAIREIILP